MRDVRPLGDAMTVPATAPAAEPTQALEIRVRGRVQGVGFRPAIWRMAHALGLAGEVFNDAEGVLLRVAGDRSRLDQFLDNIGRKLPPLARIDSIETCLYDGPLTSDFRIAPSSTGETHTQIAPDAVVCPACMAELTNRSDRHYRYPFTSCTHCGPRLSIVTAVPYDRATTTMAPFPLCNECNAEYRNPDHRRFHAEAIACPSCGPRVALLALDTATPIDGGIKDVFQHTAALLRNGTIIAVKGLGGYHLACDASNAEAIERLRRLKRRPAKPLALMARDVAIIRQYCAVSLEEERQLAGLEGPIVLLRADGPRQLPKNVAPGLSTLGFMLPSTPLHLVLMQDMDEPLVMTSGNISDEPPIIDDLEARTKLIDVASYALTHDRRIANRVDDSIVRVMAGRARVFRRARGFSPCPIRLSPEFASAPPLLAMGGELKSTFCLLKDGQAVLSQHLGDLENAATFADYRKSLALYRRLLSHEPAAIAVDLHPEYLSSKLGRAEALTATLPLVEVQHHHAHLAACLAENRYPLGARPVLGIILDGLGLGDDGTIWGGEFLLADYCEFRRLARFKPIAMPGGVQAVREPWRNLYAHLAEAIGWEDLSRHFADLDLCAHLGAKPLALLDTMITKRVNAPRASSCGRLFDAVSAALGICRERQAYEGEAAAQLEVLAESAQSSTSESAAITYAFDISHLPDGLIQLDPAPMWGALLFDLTQALPAPTIASRFHHGLTTSLVRTVQELARTTGDTPPFDTVVLSGGCFQNRLLFEQVAAQLRSMGLVVLTHMEVPANDGGLSLGQAVIAAARLLTCAITSEKG